MVSYTATGFYADSPDGRDITTEASWDSSNTDVAQVFEGRADALAPGTVNITATLSAITGSAQMIVAEREITQLEVYYNELPSMPGSVNTLPDKKDYKFRYLAPATYNDGTVEDVTASAEWSTSDNKIVKVKNNPNDEKKRGEVTPEGDEGTAQIIAEWDGLTASVDILIDGDCEFRKKDMVPREDEMAIVPGDLSVQLNATGRLLAQAWYRLKDEDNADKQCSAPVEERGNKESLRWEVTAGSSIEIDDKKGEFDAVACGTSEITATKKKEIDDGDTRIETYVMTTDITVACNLRTDSRGCYRTWASGRIGQPRTWQVYKIGDRVSFDGDNGLRNYEAIQRHIDRGDNFRPDRAISLWRDIGACGN